MKTAVKKGFVIATMLLTIATFANKNTSFNIEGKTVRVEYKNVKKGNKITIKDQSNNFLYSEKLELGGTFKKNFDLSLLNNGTYTTSLEKDFEILVETFQVIDNEIVSVGKKTIFKPLVRLENDLILISKLNFEKNNTAVIIYYNGETVVKETLNNNENVLNRVYSLNKNKKGTYRVVVRSDDHFYAKNFDLL